MKQSAKKKRIRGGEGGREKCKRQKKRDVSLRMIGPQSGYSDGKKRENYNLVLIQ